MAATYVVTTNDSAISSKGGTFFDDGFCVHAVDGEMGTRCGDIGEDAAWTTEDVVFDLNTFIDRYIILDADTVADVYVVANIHILPQGATTAYAGSFLNMAEMPHFCVFANDYVIIDVAAFMYKCLTHVFYFIAVLILEVYFVGYPRLDRHTERLSVQ